jgi:hypothetical protein
MHWPTHCAWCGAVLMGGATQHTPECWLRAENLQRGIADSPLLGRSPLQDLRAACECRTCGHVASSHFQGMCLECGREGCWS